MDADGGGLRRLAEHSARDMMPALSPDGAWIVHASQRGGYNADGLVVRLTHDKWEDGPSDWNVAATALPATE